MKHLHHSLCTASKSLESHKQDQPKYDFCICITEYLSIFAVVNIYLPNDSGNQVLMLSIPLNNIQRLSLFTLSSGLDLLFFSICDAVGNLSTTTNGLAAINYDNVSLATIPKYYYYTPHGDVLWPSRFSASYSVNFVKRGLSFH